MSFTPDIPSTEDVLAAVLSSSTPPLPPQESLVGDTMVSWWETTPGEVYIHAEGGTTDDRHYASTLVSIELEGHGYKCAQFNLDRDGEHPDSRRISAWDDIMAKSKRLLQSGQVHVLRNGFNYIVGHVVGDHGEYDTEISRDDPNSRAITSWQCSCPWDQYAWQRCVIMGTLISMADGTQKPVEEICIGDRVVDHTGAIGLVSEIHVEDWASDAITLRATGFDPITVKPDHPVWGVEADEVKCRNKNGTLAQRGGTRWRGFCALGTCGCRNPRKEVAVPSFRWAQDFEVGDYLVRPHLQPVVPIEYLDVLPMTTGDVEEDAGTLVPLRPYTSRGGRAVVARQRKASLPRYWPITDDLMRLFGFYVAEGFIAHHSVRFSFHRDETDLHDDVRGLITTALHGTPRDENNGPNALNIVVTNRELAAIFEALFGNGAAEKALPEWMMFLPTELQMSFIQGYWLGDGHCRKSDGRYEATTVSPQLAHQLELLLQRQDLTVGVIQECRTERQSGKSNERDAFKLYWHPFGKHSRGVRFSEGGNTMARIEEILRSPFEGKMYDLTIVGNPGYLANGFSVHNTRKWKKFEGRPCAHVLALYWKSLSTPLDEDLSPEQAQAMGTGQKLPAPPVAEHPPEIQKDIMQGEKHQDHIEHPEGIPRSFLPSGEINQGDQLDMATGRPGPAQAPMAPPPPEGPVPPGILPPFPGQQEMPWAGPGTTPGGGVSPPGAYTVPGAKPQTPANPIQNPSTFSKVAGLDPQVQQVLERYEALNPEVRTCDGGAAVLNDMLYRAGIPADLRCGQYWHPSTEARMKAMGGGPEDNEFLDEHHHWVELGPEGSPTHIIDPNGEERGEPRIQPYTPEVGERYAPRDNWESKSDREFMSWSPLYDNESENIAALVDAPWMETDPTVQAYRKTAADFNAPEVVKLKNDVVGLAQGPVPGQYGDGEYREVPAGSPAEVVSQDPSTGWVEVIISLDDSGPHEPYSVKCFLEPGDIEKTNQTNAFIRRHTKVSNYAPEEINAGLEHLREQYGRDIIDQAWEEYQLVCQSQLSEDMRQLSDAEIDQCDQTAYAMVLHAAQEGFPDFL